MTPLHALVQKRLKDRIGNVTFRTRIVAFFAALIAVISLFILIFFPAAIERQALSTLDRQAESISRVVAHSVASGVVFEDVASIRESLEAALQNEAVRLIEVRVREGLVVTAKADSPSETGYPSETDDAALAREEAGDSAPVLSYNAPVIFGGDRIGTVLVDLSQAQVLADVKEARGLVAVVSLGVFLFSMAAAWLMGASIVAPLVDVAATAERISDGDLSSRAEAPGNDEVGQLARSFNRMVDRLQTTQEHLLQSQKMESIGRLAGGIAHDFNNLLTTILGSTEFLMIDLPAGHAGREDVVAIQVAGERAASLTGQLLAFSRRQVTKPQSVSLNRVLTGVEKLLRRVLGEGLVLETQIEPDVVTVEIDPGHLEQVVVNLAVNARDAMLAGGTLNVSTQNRWLREMRTGPRGESIPAGRYAVLTVSDTGTGMDEETLGQIFEPFFTRKGPGEGTGLGLSTVHGIVQQAGGFIEVDSQVGVGTTFALYFPETEGAADAVVPTPRLLEPPGGIETILLVEDQDDVRKLTRKMLERLGYRVLTASGGEKALQVARGGSESIDLLLTDVVMPGMSGPLLADAMASVSPGTPVVFMSGYTDDQLQHHGVLEEGIVLIEKPFTTMELASTMRDVLNRTHSTGQLAHTG